MITERKQEDKMFHYLNRTNMFYAWKIKHCWCNYLHSTETTITKSKLHIILPEYQTVRSQS